MARTTTSNITVLKFGSSVLRSAADLPQAAQCIYRHVRRGHRVVAIVSAFAGTTDRLFAQARAQGLNREATAKHVAAGERIAAAALVTELERCGVPAIECDPPDVHLQAAGPVLDAMLEAVDVVALQSVVGRYAVTVLPGFYACDSRGSTVLLGRGGSDLTAIWIADQLGVHCTLVKDVDGLYERDPALPGPRPQRLCRASWTTATTVGGPLLQRKAVEYARVRQLEFAITSTAGRFATLVGTGPDIVDSSPLAAPIHAAQDRGFAEARIRQRISRATTLQAS